MSCERLLSLQAELESIYAVAAPASVDAFVIDRARWTQLSGSDAPEELVVVQRGDDLEIGLYLEEGLLDRLESGSAWTLDRLSAQLEALLAQRLSQLRAKRRTIPRRTSAARPVGSTVTALALSLRDLYRIAARRFHPDLACDPDDREWRAAMMRRVNTAFAQGDSATLQTLLNQPAAAHPIPSSRLAAIEFEIAQTLARIADVNATREQMEASDIGQLHAQATAEGQDPIAFLRRLAAAARAEILEKRALLAELTSPEPSP